MFPTGQKDGTSIKHMYNSEPEDHFPRSPYIVTHLFTFFSSVCPGTTWSVDDKLTSQPATRGHHYLTKLETVWCVSPTFVLECRPTNFEDFFRQRPSKVNRGGDTVDNYIHLRKKRFTFKQFFIIGIQLRRWLILDRSKSSRIYC